VLRRASRLIPFHQRKFTAIFERQFAGATGSEQDSLFLLDDKARRGPLLFSGGAVMTDNTDPQTTFGFSRRKFIAVRRNAVAPLAARPPSRDRSARRIPPVKVTCASTATANRSTSTRAPPCWTRYANISVSPEARRLDHGQCGACTV